MSLIELKGIGKIYVFGGNATVGIRGVNLAFDRGELVAITGESGSGKSTLLNVISGMDTYEEGELFVDGQPTSHYTQAELEEYRKKYISFIFQDYNILDSFTVLENVELALLHIENKKERRSRALELIDRVGLSSHIRQKGSKLSGGQKQRTVIARALAKDSPIILADEPTGNLDRSTAGEIMKLLHEVSRDKLLIVVTHSFDELESYATRHIRIFDGSVASDDILKEKNCEKFPNNEIPTTEKKTDEKAAKNAALKNDFKNGFALGSTIFKSKPKLSLLLCLVMIIGAVGIFAATSLFSAFGRLFDKSYMFTPIEGRVVLAKRSGEVITDEELMALMEKYGAESYLHYDLLLDSDYNYFSYDDKALGLYDFIEADCTYGEDFGSDIIGRYPECEREVFLYLPISERPNFGERDITVKKITYASADFDVVGIKYYYDNNLSPKCLFTKEGFNIATALYYTIEYANMQTYIDIYAKNGDKSVVDAYSIVASFDMPENKIFITDEVKSQAGGDIDFFEVRFETFYYGHNYYLDSAKPSIALSRIGREDIISTLPFEAAEEYEQMYIDARLVERIAVAALSKSYRQASVFFSDNEAAKEAASLISKEGYTAVSADTTYKPGGIDTLISVLGALASAVVWVGAVAFLSVFVSLCASRILSSLKSDIAVMRSMGIPVRVIRISMYARMLISLLPAFLAVGLVAVLVYTSPVFNGIFTYLYSWQYVIVAAGMIILSVLTTKKQMKNLFSQSVKKTLLGGE